MLHYIVIFVDDSPPDEYDLRACDRVVLFRELKKGSNFHLPHSVLIYLVAWKHLKNWLKGPLWKLEKM